MVSQAWEPVTLEDNPALRRFEGAQVMPTDNRGLLNLDKASYGQEETRSYSYGPNYDMPFMRAPGRALGAGFPAGQYAQPDNWLSGAISSANEANSPDLGIPTYTTASTLPPDYLKKINAGAITITGSGWDESKSLMSGEYTINRPKDGETSIHANGFVMDSGDVKGTLVSGVPSYNDLDADGIDRVWRRYQHLDNKSDPNSLWDRLGSLFTGKLDNPATTLSSTDREERNLLSAITYGRPTPDYLRSGLTNSTGDYWKTGQFPDKYPDLDTRAGQYRDSSGAAVAYVSPAAITPWSNAIIPDDPGSKAYQARLDHENERNVNIFMAGLGVIGEGVAVVNAASKLYTASEAGNVARWGANSTGAKLSFDTSLNTIDKAWSIRTGEILAEDPIARASYARLQSQGTNVKFVNDPNMREMGLFDPYSNEVTVNMLRHSSAEEAASTVVHEALHQNRFFQSNMAPGTQFEEYLAFRNEFLFQNARRPSLTERQQIINDVVKPLYPQLPSGNLPIPRRR